MTMVEEESLDFEALEDDAQLTAISRSSFRIPVEDLEGNTLVIEGNSYRLMDVSASGVRVSSEEKPYLGEIVENCELCIGGYIFSHLKGRVVYSAPESDHLWSFGVQWFSEDDDDNEHRMAEALQALRAEMFRQQALPETARN